MNDHSATIQYLLRPLFTAFSLFLVIFIEMIIISNEWNSVPLPCTSLNCVYIVSAEISIEYIVDWLNLTLFLLQANFNTLT